MSFTTWVRSWLSHRGKALSLYRNGMAKANKRDYDGAIADYSAAIRAPNIPASVSETGCSNKRFTHPYLRGLGYLVL